MSENIEIQVTDQAVEVDITPQVAEVTANVCLPGIPAGGTIGQVLAKSSNADYAVTWVTGGGGGGGAIWGAITGTVTDQTDLVNYVNLRVPYTGATSDVNLGEYGVQLGNIEFDLTPTGAPTGAGSMVWDDQAGTVGLVLKGGNVNAKLAQDLYARVVNKIGSNLTKANYRALRVSTPQGQRMSVLLAQGNNDNNSAETIGINAEDIANNQEGFIVTFGQITGINTTGSLFGETWADGDVLYVSPTTAGYITNVKPLGQHIVVLGYVEYAHANQGKIFVKVMNGWELEELHNVNITSPTNGQTITYNASTGKWVNTTPSTGTVTTLSVASANGFAGTVANASTTPAITLSTTITGLIKGNGTAISAATAGTDYQAPITLTTTGSSGAATFVSNTLNVPTYTLSGLGGEPAITAGTISQYFRGDKTFQTLNTTAVTEGTNLYFTNIRAQNAITLTTTGSSGAATYSGGTLNVPTYTLSGLGGQPLATNLTSLAALTFASTSFVKMTAAGTFALDTNTYLTANQTITLSGDVTGSGTTSITATIATNAVTNAKLAQVATATFKGRTTAGTGNVEDLTMTQATAMLNVFTSTLQGIVPASGGGTTNFLRADGTWAAPSGGGGGITSLNGLTAATQTFANDTNVTITSATSTHTIGWSGQLSIARGGTGQSTANAAYNALSPMTTLGDITYEASGGIATRLAGNTTTTKQFLTQTGTGTVSAAPAWGTILGADVPTFTSTLQGTVPGSGGGTTNFLRADGTWAAPSGAGITSLNGLTAGTQTFATGNTGTDVNWSSATSTHTLNIPNASTTATRGLITNASQAIGGDKIFIGSASASSGTFALIAQMQNTTSILQCRNDATVLINGTIRTIGSATFTLQGQNTTTAVTISHVSNLIGTAASTGVGNTIGCSGSTGSSDIALQSITGTVNMTTGNTSLVRGLFINPTLTSVAGTYRGLDIVAASAVGNTLMILRNATTTVLDVRSDSKIGFFAAAPVVQPTTATAAGTFTANTGTAVNDASTFSGYTIGSAIAALRNLGLLA